MKQNVPELRFAEFEGEWEEKRLGDVAKFSKGKGISKSDISDDGTLDCIRYGELYTHYGETITETRSKTNVPAENLVLSEANDIIIPASGETQIDLARASCVLKPGIALGGDINIIKTGCDGVFLSYYLNSKKRMSIANLAQGISVVHLYPSQLALLDISYPSLPEQQKIASFLTAVDVRLQLLRQKKALMEEYKKGLMQRIFSQELRFKDEEGNEFEEWEEKRLGEIGETYNGLSGKDKEDFGTGQRYIQYKQVFDDTVIDVSRCGFVEIQPGEKQNTVIYGDVLFTTSSETPEEVGYSSVYLDEEDEVYLNSFCFGYRADQNVLNPNYSVYLFRSKDFREQVMLLAQGSTRYNISKNELMKATVLLPSIKEQQKIARFLSAVDEKINLVAAQIAQTEVWKKGLMQGMFV